ncbi:Lrp/AsnC ligand binding domain-containing protein [Pontibacter sp. E15-1]|uniref:Lrp/AsnC ligand binding domain-containing protein n=1 Tax=Pontibacter sp. E15-1 TaxID=2919918 RepID=UPI001F4FA31D|nr:Lrp/AsnC ligand binding domain-containing protein [Pontibacter sp. E15-1]MCJ8166096.1 Lrp/AsnC ligand binding domain-containing protein [Pontibacter sp. E15-1]
MNYEIDNLDKQILRLLMQDVTRAYTDIAKELNVSGGTIHVRMKKLNEMGVVKGAQLLVNPSAVGFDICAFIGVFLEKGSEYKDAVEQIRAIPEVVELHYTTGTYSMFAKLICRDTKHLREVLNEKLQAVEGVQRTETLISLDESISRQILI